MPDSKQRPWWYANPFATGTSALPADGQLRKLNTFEKYALPLYLKQMLGGGLLNNTEVTAINAQDVQKDRLRASAAGFVNQNDPRTVHLSRDTIADPDDLQTHELTHVWDFSRNYAFRERDAVLDRRYDYGGIPGLQALRARGGSIKDLGPEQIAELLEDFHKLNKYYVQDAVDNPNYKNRLAKFEEAKRVYEPFIREAMQIPRKHDDEDIWEPSTMFGAIDYEEGPPKLSLAPGLPYEALADSGLEISEPSKLHGGPLVMKKTKPLSPMAPLKKLDAKKFAKMKELEEVKMELKKWGVE